MALAFLVVSIAVAALNRTVDAPVQTETHEVESLVGGLASLPLIFEANHGQTDSRVEFVARGEGMGVFLTTGGHVLNLCRHDAAGETSLCEAVRMTLEGANSEPGVSGLEPLSGVSNYLIGGDPARWQRDIPHFARVRYEQVYPGIDLDFYGNQGRLEYDFIVAPGADPGSIRVTYSGAEALSIDEAGNLVVSTSSGELLQHAPVIFQESDGARGEVSGGYALLGDWRVGFEVGDYDASRPLIIDPILSFATYLGGSGSDAGGGIAVDEEGNIYVTGRTESVNFPTSNALDGTIGGTGTDADVFVTKLSPGGRELLFSTYLGGSGFDSAKDIALDRESNIYLTGYTGSSDFPTENAIQKEKGGPGGDCFVTKLDTSGSAIGYSTYLGGSGNESTCKVAVDPAGAAFVFGSTSSTDFPTWSPVYGSNSGGKDLFVTSLPRNPLFFYYSTYLGGSDDEEAGGIAIDDDGNAYISGSTASSDFSTTNASQPQFGGGALDGFVARLHLLAFWFDYATFLGGASSDRAWDISVDQNQNSYIVSTTYSADFPTKNAFQPEYADREDVGVTRLAADGSIDLSTYLGGTGSELSRGIVVDPLGYIYLAGSTSSSDFPTANPYQGERVGIRDLFLARFAPNARALTYSTYIGGTGNHTSLDLAVDAQAASYTTGHTNSSDFPTVGAVQPAHGGGEWDAYVVRVTTPLDFFIAATRPVGVTVPAPVSSEGEY